MAGACRKAAGGVPMAIVITIDTTVMTIAGTNTAGTTMAATVTGTAGGTARQARLKKGIADTPNLSGKSL